MSNDVKRDGEDIRVVADARRADGHGRSDARETDRIGREAQRRATAYARARGQL